MSALHSDVLVIAEVAQAHDGSLGTAHAYIDAVAEAGADVVKFQTHIASAESTPQEPWRVKFSAQDATRYDYWKRMEFTEQQWVGLRSHALRAGLDFMSSAFSLEAFEMLRRVGVGGWKVASGEVRNARLLERMAATHLPVYLSTGMSPLAEIDDAVALLKSFDLPVTVLQCTSLYPTPPEKLGLNLIPEFRERWGCPVGLSDHSGTIWPSLAAVALGADVVEVHVTLSRHGFGPDVPASVTPEELKQLVAGARWLAWARAHPVDKDRMAEELAPMRGLFMKSAVAARDLPAGHVLASGDLVAKKPGTGIPAERIPALIGRRLSRAVEADRLLASEDVECGEPDTPDAAGAGGTGAPA
ncbi:MAG TPA: N-acetylneuraminate synthase family protein [Longimicrobiales bacterium]|nr:N-acetylneuraminate synthase family protein [Longimicrobiales bacterium]